MLQESKNHWDKICENPFLKDIPFKIQTDKWGNILMSPASNEHGIYQAKIVAIISRLTNNGVIISECSIQTSQGVKVADVAWASEDFMRKHKGNNPFKVSPELCIEIISPLNTEKEIDEKKELYFDRGAKEFWTCDLQGNIKKFEQIGIIGTSHIVSDFPDKISLW